MIRITPFFVIMLSLNFFIQAQTLISPNIDFEDEEQSHMLQTHNGDQFIGRIIAIRNDTVDFKLRSLENTMHFGLSEISFLGVSGESQSAPRVEPETKNLRIARKKALPMPSNQLLYTATALPFRNKGIYRNTMLFVNQIEIQPNEHFSYSIGSIIPILLSLKLQARVSISEFVHAGLVVQEHLVLYDEIYTTHAYGILTMGEYDKYLNVGFGYWINKGPANIFRPNRRNNAPAFSLGGSIILDNGWRLYTETMIIMDQFDGKYILPSFNISKYIGRSMFEAGIVSFPESGFLIPLLSYNYIF